MASAADFRLTELLLCRDPRHVDHEARVDPVVAGRDAPATIGADLGPARRISGSLAAAEQIENTADNRGCGNTVGSKVDPGRLDHRTRDNAFAAASARIEDVIDPLVQRIDKRNRL